MLAILGQWDQESGCHTDNTEKYLFLTLFKLGLDAAVFYLCCRKLYTSFLSMCSLSIILADLVMMFLLAAVWFVGAPVPLCFLLANASATYATLPLPMMSLGLLDYCLEDTYHRNQSAFYKHLRNAVLILLGWMMAVTYSLCFVKVELKELDKIGGMKALACKVEESTLIPYFILVLFTAVVCVTITFWPSIPLWLREADRISEAREEQETQWSDLMYISANQNETKVSENSLAETIWPRPPLWLSITLGFGAFWMPYLIISVIYLILDFGVPAYISVNVLWLECTNSLLMGVVFWSKSKTLGPYSHLPENVCLWHVYWHLSKGTGHQQVPIAVFNPSKGKRTSLLYV